MSGGSSTIKAPSTQNESGPQVHPPAVDGVGHGDQFTAPRRTKSFLKIGLEVVLISVGVF